jgi:hypothetical protein
MIAGLIIQWSPHINMLLQRFVYPDSPSAPFEQYYSTATGKRLGGILIYHIYTHVAIVKLAIRLQIVLYIIYTTYRLAR